LEIAEKYSYFFIYNVWALLNYKVKISDSDVLNLRLTVHERYQRWGHFAAN
jgi:hypothetical protein